MALPWEVPIPMSGTVRTRPRLPWETPTPEVPELTGAQPFPVPEADEGFLSKLGYVLDTPGAYTRGILAGDPGERVSGQDMLENWGFFDEGPDEGLFSAKGGAGLLSELVLDPMNLFFGAGALTKSGKLVKSAESALKAANTARKSIEVADATGDVIRAEKLRRRFQPALDAGVEAAKTIEQAKAGGAPNRALFGIGGEFQPIPFGPKINLPEKVLVGGDAFTDVLGGAVNKIPGVNGLRQLFQQTPLEKLTREQELFSQSERMTDEYLLKEIRRATEAKDYERALKLQEQLAPNVSGLSPAKTPNGLGDVLGIDAPTSTTGSIQKTGDDFIDSLSPNVDQVGPDDAALLVKEPPASYAAAQRAAHERLSPAASEAEQRAILNAIESGASVDEAVDTLKPIRGILDEWGQAEEKMAGLTMRSGSYVPHMATEAGRGFFKNLDSVREFERRVIESGGKVLDGGIARQLENMDPKLRATLEKRGTLGQYLEETMVGAHNKRKYDLPITKLNDIAAEMGAKAPIFEQDVRKILERRGMQHFRVKGVHDFVQGLADSPDFAALGVTRKAGEDAAQAIREGRPPLNFPDRKTEEMVTKVYRQLNDPVKVNELLDFWDNTTQMFKSYVTRPFPAFHVRNHLSNRMASSLEGVPLVGDHYKIANKVAAGQDVAVEIGGRNYTRDDLMTLYYSNGGKGGGFYEDLAEKATAGNVSRPKAFQGDWNPFNPDNKMIQGMEKASATIAGAPGRLASGVDLKNANGDAMTGEVIEFTDRFGHWIAKMQQGMSPKTAMESMNKALFDYSKAGYTSFENDYLRRGALFYTYTRNVIPFMLEKALEKPGAVSGISRLANQPGKPEHLPSWASEGLPLPIGKDAEGNSMLAYGLGTPLEAAVEPFAGFSDGVGRGLEKLLTQLNPAIKMPLEVATGKDFFLGKEVEDLRKAPNYADELPDFLKDTLGVKEIPTKAGGTRLEMDPWTAYGLRNNPMSRFGTTASKVFDDRKGAGETLANILTGARVVSIDEEKEAQYAVRQAIIDRLKELEREGKAKSFDTFGYGAGEKDPEVKELLKLLRGK